MEPYVIIRRYGDDREEEQHDWDGNAWPIESDGLQWKVTRVVAGAIVLEPVDD
jgi:hypothetical protein